MPDDRVPRLPAPVRLGPRHKRVVYTAVLALWGSGALWLLFHYFFASPGPFGPRPHPMEQWWLRLHGLAMMATLGVFGSLLLHHAPRAWQLRKNRRLGILLGGGLLWLAATGYALYYFSSDANAGWLPLIHWLPGLALPVLLAVHVRIGRARKSAAHRVAALTPPAAPRTTRHGAQRHRAARR